MFDAPAFHQVRRLPARSLDGQVVDPPQGAWTQGMTTSSSLSHAQDTESLHVLFPFDRCPDDPPSSADPSPIGCQVHTRAHTRMPPQHVESTSSVPVSTFIARRLLDRPDDPGNTRPPAQSWHPLRQ
jgi:hypothetical protein